MTPDLRKFAETLIAAAGTAAGLSSAAVLPRQEGVADLLLPRPRLEIDWLPEELTPEGRKLARVTGDPLRETIRLARYRARLTARCVVAASDADQLEALCRAFILALPKTVADPDNNVVRIAAERAVRGGFNQRLVEIEKRLSNAVHVTFEHFLCLDQATPWILDVEITPRLGPVEAAPPPLRRFGAAPLPAALDGAFLAGLATDGFTGRVTEFTATAGPGEHLWFACAADLGAPSFYVGGFAGGFVAAGVVTDPAYAAGRPMAVWRSVHPGLGLTTVEAA